MRDGEVGVEFHRLEGRRLGGFHLMLVSQRHRHVAVGQRVLRVEVDRLLVGRDRAGVILLAVQGARDSHGGAEVLRIQVKNAIEKENRVIHRAPAFQEHVADEIICKGTIGAHGQGRAGVREAGLQPVGLGGHYAAGHEQVEPEIVWVRRLKLLHGQRGVANPSGRSRMKRLAGLRASAEEVGVGADHEDEGAHVVERHRLDIRPLFALVHNRRPIQRRLPHPHPPYGIGVDPVQHGRQVRAARPVVAEPVVHRLNDGHAGRGTGDRVADLRGALLAEVEAVPGEQLVVVFSQRQHPQAGRIERRAALPHLLQVRREGQLVLHVSVPAPQRVGSARVQASAGLGEELLRLNVVLVPQAVLRPRQVRVGLAIAGLLGRSLLDGSLPPIAQRQAARGQGQHHECGESDRQNAVAFAPRRPWPAPPPVPARPFADAPAPRPGAPSSPLPPPRRRAAVRPLPPPGMPSPAAPARRPRRSRPAGRRRPPGRPAPLAASTRPGPWTGTAGRRSGFRTAPPPGRTRRSARPGRRRRRTPVPAPCTPACRPPNPPPTAPPVRGGSCGRRGPPAPWRVPNPSPAPRRRRRPSRSAA